MKRWQILERFNLGGPGSGHHGHKSIPGHRGGSAPSGGGMQFREGWEEYKKSLFAPRTDSGVGLFGAELYRVTGVGSNYIIEKDRLADQIAALDGMSQDELVDFMADLPTKLGTSWSSSGMAMCASRMDETSIKKFVDTYATDAANAWAEHYRKFEAIGEKYGQAKPGTAEYREKLKEEEALRSSASHIYDQRYSLNAVADFGGSRVGREYAVDKLLQENARVGWDVAHHYDKTPFGTRLVYMDYTSNKEGDQITIPRTSRAIFNSMSTGDVGTDAKLLLSGWTANADRPAALWMHAAVADEFSGKSSIEGFWNPASIGVRFSEPDPGYKAAVRWMHDKTQASLASSSSISLYRGVSSAISVRSYAESWTLSDSVARRFNGHSVLHKTVPSNSILYSYKSLKGYLPPEKQLAGKEEFVVLPYME